MDTDEHGYGLGMSGGLRYFLPCGYRDTFGEWTLIREDRVWAWSIRVHRCPSVVQRIGSAFSEQMTEEQPRMETSGICAVTTEDRTVRDRLGVRWLDTDFDRPARRPARPLNHRLDARFKGDESSLVIQGGVEPPHSISD